MTNYVYIHMCARAHTHTGKIERTGVFYKITTLLILKKYYLHFLVNIEIAFDKIKSGKEHLPCRVRY